MSLENRIAIITGGAQGIGYAIAERFLREKAKVVIADIDDKAGKAALQVLRRIGTVNYIHCNVAERLDVHNLVAGTIDEFGRIDILVNNAGIAEEAGFLEISEEDFDRVMDINLKGAFLCSQAVARHQVEQVQLGGTPGTILNISSVASVLPIADQVPYSISKGGLGQLTSVASLALAEHGIRVNAIGPGSISTGMLTSAATDPEAQSEILSHPSHVRNGDPKEIAAIAAFLASDEASYITGQTLYVDGGRSGQNFTLKSKT